MAGRRFGPIRFNTAGKCAAPECDAALSEGASGFYDNLIKRRLCQSCGERAIKDNGNEVLSDKPAPKGTATAANSGSAVGSGGSSVAPPAVLEQLSRVEQANAKLQADLSAVTWELAQARAEVQEQMNQLAALRSDVNLKLDSLLDHLKVTVPR